MAPPRARGLHRIVLGLVLGGAAILGGPNLAGGGPLIDLEPVATGLANPVGLVDAGDGSGRLFILLQAGRIVILVGGQVLPTPFLDVRSLVSCCGERGLLGLAFHPNYPVNGLFYVYYTDTNGTLVLARYQVSANPNVADPNSAQIVLTIPHPTFGNHNGGQLQFGPDGFLYIGPGGGGAGDPSNNAQNLGTLLGKLLRIDVNQGSPYAIPPDNPFVATPGARGEIWALGLRNPWRFSFDRVTHDLSIADVGQDSREEVDFQPAGSRGGQNYCWRRLEGTLLFNPDTSCTTGTPTPPILEYDHVSGNCAIVGGYRYRGTLVPPLAGAYLFGDFCSGRIWTATPNSQGTWTATELLATGQMISAFGEDQTGELYVVHYGPSGVISRIVSRTPPVALSQFITRFYAEVLGRAPEPAGLDGWVNFLNANCNAQGFDTLARGFFDSTEFRTTRPLSLSDLVAMLYQTFLGRTPDPAGLAGWANLFRQGRLMIALQGFIPSQEFQSLLPNRADRAAVTTVVTRLYQQVLGRDPEPAGLQAWVDFIVTTGKLEDAAQGFLASQEFEAKPQTFRDYVTTLYRTFLNRDPEPAGLDAWEGVLRNTLLQVINQGFVPSPEFQGLVPQVCG